MSALKTTILNQPLDAFLPKNPFGSHGAPLPKTASSFALAESMADLSRFSHAPSRVTTFTETQVLSNALSPSRSNAIAEANAIFIGGGNVPTTQTNGSTDALSIVDGTGSSYQASAIARTQIKGLDFYVKAKETFTFNFTGSMSLIAQGSTPRQQSFAQGRTTYLVYGTDDRGNRTLLDQLIVEGRQYSTFNNGPFNGLSVAAGMFSKGFSLNLKSQPLPLSSNALSFNGIYSRTFNTAMQISIVEKQQTTAKVSFSFADKGKSRNG